MYLISDKLFDQMILQGDICKKCMISVMDAIKSIEREETQNERNGKRV